MISVRVALLGAFFIFSPFSFAAGDVQSLEEAFENVIDRLNEHDQEGFLKVWHPEAVLIVYDYLFPVDRSDAGDEVWAQIFKDFFSTTEITLTPVDVDFRVVGDTGLVWGLTQTMVKLTGGNSEVRSLRVSATFVKTGNHWKLMNWHSSLPPERNRGSR
jgi:ketosteroid isomerase-like protein